MTLKTAVEIVTDYQKYRRGEDPYEYGQDGSSTCRYSPKEIGEAIDVLLNNAKQLTK